MLIHFTHTIIVCVRTRVDMQSISNVITNIMCFFSLISFISFSPYISPHSIFILHNFISSRLSCCHTLTHTQVSRVFLYRPNIMRMLWKKDKQTFIHLYIYASNKAKVLSKQIKTFHNKKKHYYFCTVLCVCVLCVCFV